MTPAGLVSVRPAFLKRVVALYVLLAVIALAIPALIAKPRGDLPHLNEQEARRPAARPGLAQEPRDAPIGRIRREDALDRHFATDLFVARHEHLAHAATSDRLA